MYAHLHTLAIACKTMGIKQVVISPGSRSAELVFAFAQQNMFSKHTVVDERSAAYQALGMAEYTQKPVVLICTSGTAAANYLPAVAEAHYKKIPLFIITADRPKTLLNQQDGQMINQHQLYGSHVRCFVELKQTYADTELAGLFNLFTNTLNSITQHTPGVAHINVPLNEPTYEINFSSTQLKKLEQQLTRGFKPPVLRQKNLSPEFLKAWHKAQKKLIIIGQGVVNTSISTQLMGLAKHQNVVILADVASNKHAYATIGNFDMLLGNLTDKKLDSLNPDLLISIGGPMLSKNLKNWLRQQQPQWHFRVKNGAENIDTYLNVTQQLYAKADAILAEAAKHPSSATSDYKLSWQLASAKLSSSINIFSNQKIWSEIHAVSTIINKLPTATHLHLANSSVVRYVSLLGNLPPSVIVTANRGTSGIDGCTSTAVGAALVNNRLTTLITGDLAFLYDKNALWQNTIPANLRIIVLNNQGGGIFRLINGPTRHKQFENYFLTPHMQNIRAIAQASGIDNCYFCNQHQQLDEVLTTFFTYTGKPALLELGFSSTANAQVFKKFKTIK